MSRSGCQVAAMIDLHTESYVLWLRLVSSSPPPQKKKKNERENLNYFIPRKRSASMRLSLHARVVLL